MGAVPFSVIGYVSKLNGIDERSAWVYGLNIHLKATRTNKVYEYAWISVTVKFGLLNTPALLVNSTNETYDLLHITLRVGAYSMYA